jgi:hypothetical protein
MNDSVEQDTPAAQPQPTPAVEFLRCVREMVSWNEVYAEAIVTYFKAKRPESECVPAQVPVLKQAMEITGFGASVFAFLELVNNPTNGISNAIVDLVFNQVAEIKALALLNGLTQDQDVTATIHDMIRWHYTSEGVFVLDSPKVLETKEGLLDTPFTAKVLDYYQEFKAASLLRVH